MRLVWACHTENSLMRKWTLRIGLALLVTASLAACGGGDNNDENNATQNNSTENNTSENNSSQQDMGSPEEDMGAGEEDMPPGEDMPPEEDMAPEVCPDAPPCRQGYEYDDACECVIDFDRECETDADCRAEETCEDIPRPDSDRVDRICWLEESSLTMLSGVGEGELQAAAVSKVITPQGFETAKPAGLDGAYMNFDPPVRAGSDKWNDCGYDGLCPGDEGYPGPDEGEGDGELQGMFIAGFSHGRPAQYCPEELIGCDRPECCVSKYAHDDIKIQIVVFRKGDATVAFAALDAVGYFHTYIEEIRRRVQERVDVDLLILGSSHSHEGPDTVGQWGPGNTAPLRPGRDARFMQSIQDQAVAGIEEAVGALRPARIESTIVDADTEGLAMSDSRPPYIFDDNIPVVRVLGASDGESIATMLSVGNHAEVLWSGNPYITADYFHFARKYIREGLEAVTDEQGNEIKPALEGFGGVTVMFAGAVGGLINPGKGSAIDYAGEEFEEDDFAKADAVGQRIAMHVLEAHREGAFEATEDAALTFATKRFLTPITNKVFLLAGFVLEVFERDIYNANHISVTNFAPGPPLVMSQVAAVKLGPVTFFTAPGEVFPELLVGGYPERPRAQDPTVGDVLEQRVDATCDMWGLPTMDGGMYPCIVKADQENPPDWSMAPEGPYVYDLIEGRPFFIGLGMDFLGYMVPPYDYEPDNAPGAHYEETNGASGEIVDDWLENLQAVLDVVQAD